MQENMYRIYVNIILFYVRDLRVSMDFSIQWYPVHLAPTDTKENCIRIPWAVLQKICFWTLPQISLSI